MLHTKERIIRLFSYFLFSDAGKRMRRWQEERIGVRESDYVFVSEGKSGRTWVRFMLSKILRDRHRLPEGLLLDRDNFHKLAPAVPIVFFTHSFRPDDAPPEKLINRSVDLYRDKRVIFLHRDPRDVTVSLHFERSRRDRKRSDLDLAAFFWDSSEGLHSKIAYLNLWDEILARLDDPLVLRYEQIMSNPGFELSRLAAYMGLDASPAEIDAAVADGAFENMRKIEASGIYQGQFLGARDPSDPDSFKVRRGKVGGYRDYFGPEDLARIDAVVASDLRARFAPMTEPAIVPSRPS